MPSDSSNAAWTEAELGSLCSLRGESVKATESDSSCYVGLEHISSGKYFLKEFSDPKEFKSTAHVFAKGEILYGKLRPYLDKAVVTDVAGICSTELLVLSPHTSSDVSFILSVLHSKEFIDYAQSSADKQYPRTSWNWISKFPIKLPPPNERKAIGSVLWKIQQAIEVETNLIRATRELKAAVMKKLFTEGLNGEPQKETEIGMVPESWDVSELREFVTIKSGGTPSRDKLEYWNEGTIPWVKTGEVDYCVITDTSERITEAGMENSAAKIFPSGTLLMAMYGQGVTRGKVALLGIPAATNQACAAIFPDDRVTSLFLSHFLEFQYENIRGMGHGANQKNLNSDIIKAIKCPIPSPAEQSAICRCLDTLNSSLLNLENKRVVLESLFQSSLQNLISGSIRVTDLLLDSSLSFESQGVAA